MEQQLLKIHRNLKTEDFTKIWKEAIFIFDSNVLLDLYRLPESAKNDLLTVLQNKEFNARIWIGFQVLLEFLNNRLNIIGEQKNMFSKVINITNNHIEKIKDQNNEYIKEITKLNLTERHSNISPTEFINSKKVEKTLKVFNKFIEHLNQKETEHGDVNDEDEIKELILEIFKNKIGKPLEGAEIDKISVDGEVRYKEKLPPGYMDVNKEGFHIVKNQKYHRKFGDLYLWHEIINHVNNNNLKSVVLITGDVKQDWWEEKRGRKIGPRKELMNEIYNSCADLDIFHIYNTSTFLKYAQEEIDSDIKDSSIEETRRLINYNSKIEIRHNDLMDLKTKLRFTDEKIEDLSLDIEKCQQELRRIDLYRNRLYEDKLIGDEIGNATPHLSDLENELEEQVSLNNKKLSSLYNYKTMVESQLEFITKK